MEKLILGQYVSGLLGGGRGGLLGLAPPPSIGEKFYKKAIFRCAFAVARKFFRQIPFFRKFLALPIILLKFDPGGGGMEKHFRKFGKCGEMLKIDGKSPEMDYVMKNGHFY